MVDYCLKFTIYCDSVVACSAHLAFCVLLGVFIYCWVCVFGWFDLLFERLVWLVVFDGLLVVVVF